MPRSPQSSQVLGRRGFRLAVVIGGVTIAAATATGVVLAGHFVNPPHALAHAAVQKTARVTPTTSQVEHHLAGVVNVNSEAIGKAVRIEHVSCISGSPGSYACSYVRSTPSRPGICSVAILNWTPDGDSTYTVMTAGRVALSAAACGPVTKVLHVLGTS
jgi:hypothetical protein